MMGKHGRFLQGKPVCRCSFFDWASTFARRAHRHKGLNGVEDSECKTIGAKTEPLKGLNNDLNLKLCRG